jgi:hypothetical protein
MGRATVTLFRDMLTAIFVGLVVITVLSVGSAALIYGHLTGRVRKPVTVAAILASIVLGAGLLADRVLDGDVFGHVMFPIGVFFLMAGAITGLVMLGLGPTPAARR